MATMTTVPAAGNTTLSKGETLHRVVMWGTIAAGAALLIILAVNGFSYYSLSLEERPHSSLHTQLRPSGTIGLRLGLLGIAMFGVLFLYPLRKRWRWLARIGATRRWLRLHVLLGIAMFAVLFLYPLRKRWKWLARIGATRRWLRLHVLFGIATPLVVTFHTAFRFHGLAGLAYWP
jgi:hypothetical protein